MYTFFSSSLVAPDYSYYYCHPLGVFSALVSVFGWCVQSSCKHHEYVKGRLMMLKYKKCMKSVRFRAVTCMKMYNKKIGGRL